MNVLIVVLGVFLVGCGCGASSPEPEEPPPQEPPPQEPPPQEPPPGGGDGNVRVSTEPCTQDSDCVPAACCHPSACVARGGPNVPNCADTMCTMECRYGTLDCGGSCFCQGGFCAARLSQDPHPQVQQPAPAPTPAPAP